MGTGWCPAHKYNSISAYFVIKDLFKNYKILKQYNVVAVLYTIIIRCDNTNKINITRWSVRYYLSIVTMYELCMSILYADWIILIL